MCFAMRMGRIFDSCTDLHRSRTTPTVPVVQMCDYLPLASPIGFRSPITPVYCRVGGREKLHTEYLPEGNLQPSQKYLGYEKSDMIMVGGG